MKALIMIVRLTGLIAIILGVTLWNSGNDAYLGLHIGVGFLVVTLLMVMAVLAIMKKAVVPGVVVLVLAILLPVIGFMQLPLFTRSLHGVQLAHFAIAIAVLGLGERLYAAIRAAS
jgi:hypothetical protein